MYCRRCLAALPELPADPALTSDPWLSGKSDIVSYASRRPLPPRCSRCFRKYDPHNPKTYLASLALTPWEIAVKIILTTVIGLAAAGFLAFHQMAMNSGH